MEPLKLRLYCPISGGLVEKLNEEQSMVAHTDLMDDLNEIDKNHLLSRLVNQPKQSICGSIKEKNYCAAVYGIKLMNK